MAKFEILNGKLLKTTLTDASKLLEIPDTVTEIGDYGLDITSNNNQFNVAVTKLIIPSSIIACSFKAFKGFINLQEIELTGSSSFFILFKDMLLSKNKGYIFVALKNITGDLKIDWALQVYAGPHAFEYCRKLTKIDLSCVTTSLGDYCFFHCENLEEIKLPIALQNFDLGIGLFSDCYKLKSLCIPKNISIIPESFAQNCHDLQKVYIMDTRNKLEIICKNAFFNCTSLTAFSYYFPGFSGLEIEDRLSEIEDYAFGNCKWLTEVALYSMRIDIANNAFDGCDNVYFFCREKSDVEAFALQKGFRFYHFSN